MRRNSYSTPSRPGYILLILILIIGAVCSVILSSLLLLGSNASHVSMSVEQSGKALELAQGCAEYGLQKLRTSLTYSGDEVLTYGSGVCELLTIGGIGNTSRLLCTEGQSGDSIRRLEIVVSQLLPKTTIFSWQEVSSFSLCE